MLKVKNSLRAERVYLFQPEPLYEINRNELKTRSTTQLI